MFNLPYKIHFGNINDNLYNFFQSNSYNKIAVLTDENTNELCYPLIKDFLPNNHIVIKTKSGEKYKNMEETNFIIGELIKNNIDRNGLIINLGGGMLSDLGGFAASIFKRGIQHVNIPTTVLAQVDAAVGGKTGVNFIDIKNVIGVFNNPKALFIDTVFYKTLPENQIKSGFAEMIKHALLKDKQYFLFLQQIRFDSFDFLRALEQSVKIKAEIVNDDFLENNKRKSLNLGHTIGHAFESFFMQNKNPILHGEAVAIGLVCELYISKKYSGFPENEFDFISKYILSIYPKRNLNNNDIQKITQLTVFDKKNMNDKINVILLSDYGKAITDFFTNESVVKEAVAYYNNC